MQSSNRGPIVNQAADAVVGCLVPPDQVTEASTREELVSAFQRQMDRYAAAGVGYLFLNACYQRAAYPSAVWDTYWDVADPATQTSDWPRLTWICHSKGVDPYAVCVRRCRERGVSPWMSMRMNDTHYLDDPTKTSRLWLEHPELRQNKTRGFDFSHERVQEHYLALIAELVERYDCDGVELDWMRFPWHFNTGEEANGCARLNAFMRRARRLTAAAAEKRGHPVGIAARIPAVPEAALGLGMDGVTWAREGLVDVLVLASVWRPSDTDIPIEQWRERIGSEARNVQLAACTDLWLQGVQGGPIMRDDVESQRAFTAAMLDRGADLIYLFNHFNTNDFRRTVKGEDGRPVVLDQNHEMLCLAGRMDAALRGPRRHVLTFHDPAPPGAEPNRALPAALQPGVAVELRLYTGPAPAAGCVSVRIGLDQMPGVEDAILNVRLNSAACALVADLATTTDWTRHPQDRLVVPNVGDTAERVLEFRLSCRDLQRGYNTISVALAEGAPQRVTWVELYIEPAP